MSVVVDTSVIIDVLRGSAPARALLRHERTHGLLNASELTRAEVLAGMRPVEEAATRELLEAFTWRAVDREIAERAADYAREFRASHSGIDLVDYVIAATADVSGARLLTRNVKHFPMLDGLRAPY